MTKTLIKRNTGLLVALFVAVIAIVPSCHQRQKSQNAEAVIADTVTFHRDWNDPEFYVMGKPSEEKIIEWKTLCERGDTNMLDALDSHELDSSMTRRYLAFLDIAEILYQEDSTYRDDFDFLCWRMNEELAPDHNPRSERERYSILEAQLDSLTVFYDGCTWEMNDNVGIRRDFFRMLAKHISGKLQEVLPECSEVIRKEHDTYMAYEKASAEVFEKVVLGDPRYWGTAIPSCLISYEEMLYSDYVQYILPVYLEAAEHSGKASGKAHDKITSEQISRAYGIFLNSITDEEDPDLPAGDGYKGPDQRKSIKADESAWNSWAAAMNAVSNSIPSNLRHLYDNSGNELIRNHLVELLDRYTSCMMMEEDYYDLLLKADCSDEELRSYDFDAAMKNYWR